MTNICMAADCRRGPSVHATKCKNIRRRRGWQPEMLGPPRIHATRRGTGNICAAADCHHGPALHCAFHKNCATPASAACTKRYGRCRCKSWLCADCAPPTRRQWLPWERAARRGGSTGSSGKPPILDGKGGFAGRPRGPRRRLGPEGRPRAPAGAAARPGAPADGAGPARRRRKLWSQAGPADPTRAEAPPRTRPCAACAGTDTRTQRRAPTPRVPATRPAPPPRRRSGTPTRPPPRPLPSSPGPRLGTPAGRPATAPAASPPTRSGAWRTARGRREGRRPPWPAA
mmetsp:Transcript_19238/g.57559  ORF Transcript_19238/g.57559 Transcript_19238/m.57559 type:complete len:286 (-) Transcript_19238:345-1202(-)